MGIKEKIYKKGRKKRKKKARKRTQGSTSVKKFEISPGFEDSTNLGNLKNSKKMDGVGEVDLKIQKKKITKVDVGIENVAKFENPETEKNDHNSFNEPSKTKKKFKTTVVYEASPSQEFDPIQEENSLKEPEPSNGNYASNPFQNYQSSPQISETRGNGE